MLVPWKYSTFPTRLPPRVLNYLFRLYNLRMAHEDVDAHVYKVIGGFLA